MSSTKQGMVYLIAAQAIYIYIYIYKLTSFLCSHSFINFKVAVISFQIFCRIGFLVSNLILFQAHRCSS